MELAYVLLIEEVLDMCDFYWTFIPDFAAVTEPWNNLLKKDAKYVWTDTCDHAFRSVKAILACEPVLLAPNFEAPFKLAVDACDIGVGEVPMQADAVGQERPVTYYLKKQNKHQNAYSNIEKEALGLVLVFKHFEMHLAH